MIKKTIFFSLFTISSLSFGMDFKNSKNVKLKQKQNSLANAFRQDMNNFKKSSCSDLIRAVRQLSFAAGSEINNVNQWQTLTNLVHGLAIIKCDPDSELYQDIKLFDYAVETIAQKIAKN